jgi:hypothetical protein
MVKPTGSLSLPAIVREPETLHTKSSKQLEAPRLGSW